MDFILGRNNVLKGLCVLNFIALLAFSKAIPLGLFTESGPLFSVPKCVGVFVRQTGRLSSLSTSSSNPWLRRSCNLAYRSAFRLSDSIAPTRCCRPLLSSRIRAFSVRSSRSAFRLDFEKRARAVLNALAYASFCPSSMHSYSAFSSSSRTSMSSSLMYGFIFCSGSFGGIGGNISLPLGCLLQVVPTTCSRVAGCRIVFGLPLIVQV